MRKGISIATQQQQPPISILCKLNYLLIVYLIDIIFSSQEKVFSLIYRIIRDLAFKFVQYEKKKMRVEIYSSYI